MKSPFPQSPALSTISVSSLPPKVNPSFGILLTAYLWKQTSRTRVRTWTRKFLVLTKVGLHWFRRSDGYDLFGEETGHLNLVDIKSVNPHGEQMSAMQAHDLFHSSSNNSDSDRDSPAPKSGSFDGSASSDETVKIYSFIVKSQDGYSRAFRCSTWAERERWIEALTMCIANVHSENTLSESLSAEEKLKRSTSICGVDFAPIKSSRSNDTFLYHSDLGGTCWAGAVAPVALVISVGHKIYDRTEDASYISADLFSETQTGENDFGMHNQTLIAVLPSEEVKVYLSNGGCMTLTTENLKRMSEVEIESEDSSSGIEKCDLYGLRYPSAPDSLKARLGVRVTKETDSKTKFESLMTMATTLKDEVNSPNTSMRQKIASNVGSLSSNKLSYFLLVVCSSVPPLLSLMSESSYQSEEGNSAGDKISTGQGLLSFFFSSFAEKQSSKNDNNSNQSCSNFSFDLNLCSFNFLLPYIHLVALLSGCFLYLFSLRIKPTKFKITLLSYEESEVPAADDFPVPSRFVQGTKNDPPGTAERRWATTRAWRKQQTVDTILLQKHPHFLAIKRCYPHFYVRHSANGKDICYYERPGYLELEDLEKIGLTAVVRHYIWQVEFCWTYMATGEDTKSMSGVDVQNVGLYDLKGVVKEFLGAITKISQNHYPERAGQICVLNAPSWFTMLWNIIKLMLHPNTQKKVFILDKAGFVKTLQKLINVGDLPIEYGGGLDFYKQKFAEGAEGKTVPTVAEDFHGPLGKEKEAARYCSEWEVAMADYVRRLNAGEKLPLPPAHSWQREDVVTPKEDYLGSYEGGWEAYESQLHLKRAEWDPEGWPGKLFK